MSILCDSNHRVSLTGTNNRVLARCSCCMEFVPALCALLILLDYPYTPTPSAQPPPNCYKAPPLWARTGSTSEGSEGGDCVLVSCAALNQCTAKQLPAKFH